MNIRKPDILRSYLRHKDINNYLDYLGRRFSQFVTVCTIGTSFEGRAIKALRIDLRKKNTVLEKNWTLIEAGTHGREWITISVALYCIYQLAEKSFRNMDLLERMAFVIVPLVNADGYEFTHEKNSSWRKNRRPTPNCSFIGTDCNRNYDFHWEGGTTRFGKNTYQGEMPFSESETRAVRNVVKKLHPNLKFFLSFHSYAQSIMYPWAYTKELPAKWEALHALAVCGKTAIQKATGRKYRCGSISKLTRQTVSGSVADYIYGAEKIPFVLVMELPSAKYGFQPPADKIQALISESWIGIKAMCRQVSENCGTVK